MTSPTVLMNTYIEISSKPSVDLISKIFVICEIPFGINRLPLLGNLHLLLIILSAIYSLGVVGIVINYINYTDVPLIIKIGIGTMLTQFVFLVSFNLISVKRLQRYYSELHVFNGLVCCTPKIGKRTVQNVVYAVFIALYVIGMYVTPYYCTSLKKLEVAFVPCVACHFLEVHFIGHLLSLIIPRLRMINYYMELSLSNTKIRRSTSAAEFGFKTGSSNESLCDMKKLMNLYHIVIKAYTYLMEAIKWQLLVIIIASFLTVLCYGYHAAYSLINGESPIAELLNGVQSWIGILLPLFVPCTLGDQIHSEVGRLRELLASRLYENKLDKSSRTIARALLAWTETRDLSFSLLRMLKIDISLPFKFIGLLVTYLIILLQFQKVINP